MQLQSLGYVGVRTADIEEWETYATRFLGMQLVEQEPPTFRRCAWMTASNA